MGVDVCEGRWFLCIPREEFDAFADVRPDEEEEEEVVAAVRKVDMCCLSSSRIMDALLASSGAMESFCLSGGDGGRCVGGGGMSIESSVFNVLLYMLSRISGCTLCV